MSDPNSYEFQRRVQASEEIRKSSGSFVDAQVELGGELAKLGGGLLAKVLMVILIIILILPVIVSVIVSLIFNLLFKARAFGRVVQSVIIGLLCGFSIIIGCFAISSIIAENFLSVNIDTVLTMSGIIGMAMALIGALWYNNSGYFIAKARGYVDLIIHLTISLAIIYYPLLAFVIFSSKIPALVAPVAIPVLIFLAVVLFVRAFSRKKFEKEIVKEKKYLTETLAKHPNDDGWYTLWNSGYNSLNEFKEGHEGSISEIESKIQSVTQEKAQNGKAPIPTIISLALTFVISFMFFNGLQGKINAAKRDTGSTLIFYTEIADTEQNMYYHNMYEEPNANSQIIKKLENGNRLSATGGFVRRNKENGDVDFVEVDFNGTKGWVNSKSTHTVLDTATVISNEATWRHREEVRRAIFTTSPISNGETVDIIGVDKKAGTTTIIYRGEEGTIASNLITTGDPSKAVVESNNYAVSHKDGIRFYEYASNKRFRGRFEKEAVIKATGITSGGFSEVFTEGASFYDDRHKNSMECAWVKTSELKRRAKRQ